MTRHKVKLVISHPHKHLGTSNTKHYKYMPIWCKGQVWYTYHLHSSHAYASLHIDWFAEFVHPTSLWRDPFICISLRHLIVVSFKPHISAYWRLGGQRLHNSNTCKRWLCWKTCADSHTSIGLPLHDSSVQIDLSKWMLIIFKTSRLTYDQLYKYRDIFTKKSLPERGISWAP